MHSLFVKVYNRAHKHTRLSEQNHPTVLERGRGVEFHLQDVEFDSDDVPREVVKSPAYRSPPFLSPDGMTVFTVQSFCCTAGRTRFTRRYFIVRHSLIDGQSSYSHIAEFDGIDSLNDMRFYTFSNDRLGALDIDKRWNIVNQYVIRIEHQSRLAVVTSRRSLPLGSYPCYSRFSLQLDDRIVLSSESSPILILAADIEAPESDKYCHCCQLDGYYSRLEIEARNRDVLYPSFGTLTLGRNGVYVCARPKNGTEPFGVLGLEWQRNDELPEDLCCRHAEDTVPVFYRLDQQSVNIHDGVWFKEMCSNGLAAFTHRLTFTLDVFVLDLTRLVRGDAHPEMHCTQSTISVPADRPLWFNRLNRVPGTSSIIAQFGHPSNLLRLRSAFDVPPLRQLAFEAVYKNMKPEERSKPGWMQILCGFECV